MLQITNSKQNDTMWKTNNTIIDYSWEGSVLRIYSKGDKRTSYSREAEKGEYESIILYASQIVQDLIDRCLSIGDSKRLTLVNMHTNTLYR